MGIRKSYGKNKKDKRPTGAIAAKRDETLRRAEKSKQARRSSGDRDRASKPGRVVLGR